MYETLYFYMYILQFRKAKLLLRKKKFQESLLEKTDNQLDNIERMVCMDSNTNL